MVQISRRVREIEGCRPDSLPLEELLAAAEPRVLKGLVADWEITRVGLRADGEAIGYLRSFYNGKPLSASFGPPEIGGRLFYNEAFTELNFSARRAQLDAVLEEIQAHLADERPPTIYVGSTLIDGYLPGFRRENDVGFAAHGIDPPPSIWIGNRTIASCHFDAPNNLACCVVGRRRFTLFPPDQIFNLYPGPFEPSPGGQAISLVDFEHPDFERFPRFRAALDAGQVAEVEPGDAVFIPSMWWHHVQGLSPFNTLVNYWWSMLPAFIPTPMNALYHAIWSVRDRPENEKRAWKHVFDYYVFGSSTLPGAHFPEQARGVLGPIDDDMARHIRAMLISKLNR
ncbi:MAG TPA: cupin-like domain-containing protein [Vicinamibacterales bacterium]|nr:cupin-like domain-containing protein [Vicinamibacterales bacterium]